ncbi:terpene synthase family protein [Stigmatella hybrida]|uniref:terpene synthase family protein n=1 Tax=Stigmatella hybrida TaxID=394097 RepID=UPI001CDA9283|nr:terpene synthase family protein [Stigmatella hybrida]
MSSRPENLLRSTFLDSLPGPECEHIFALTQELSAPLAAWCAKYPSLLRSFRVPQVGLTLAASAPFLSARELLPTGRLFLWLFAVDDLCDERPHAEEAASPLTLCARFEQAMSVLETPGAPCASEDPLHQAMRDIREGLTSLPLFSALRTSLLNALRDFLRGMQLEVAWSHLYRQSPPGPAPSLQEYLEKAACFTTGTLPIYLGVLMATRDEAILPRLPHFMGLGHEAAVSIRLANDLRTYEKELAEGKLNALILLQRERMEQHGQVSADALDRGRAEVKAHLLGALERCSQLGGEEATAGCQATQTIVNAVAFACGFYAHHDFHHALVRQDGHRLGEARPPRAAVTPSLST